MQDEITIVSAFYKLNLHKQSTQSYKAERTSKTYLDYFSFNAGLKNKMIIYIDDIESDESLDMQKEIYALRAKHNLESKTLVIKKSLKSFASSEYDAIKECFKKYNQTKDRFDSIHPPHNSPEYDFLMYAKSFFVLDAISRSEASERILWLDFGFNFNGQRFIESSDFNFTLKPQRNLNIDLELASRLNMDISDIAGGGGVIQGMIDSKLNLFSLGKCDDRALAVILTQGTSNFLIGGCIYGNRAAWSAFNTAMQKALSAFLSFNTMDDDQKMYIWCVRNFPDIFNILPLDDWFYALFYFMDESKRKVVKTATPSIFGGIAQPIESTQSTESKEKPKKPKKPKGLKKLIRKIFKTL